MIDKVVKQGREQRGLSQISLSALAGIPRSQLQILEKGGNVTRETLEKVLRAMGMSLMAVSGDEITRMREALAEMSSVIAGLAAQVTAPPAPDPHRLLQMSRDLVDYVRATQGEAAAAPLLAAVEAQAATLDRQVAEVAEGEREARERRRAKRARKR
jgi:transcriptional regulator with XRE-family HTH domain